jgi:hypothetical protein
MADNLSPLLSVGQIAILVNRTTMTVQRHIRKKGIQPALLLGMGGKRYDPSVVALIGPFKRPTAAELALKRQQQ